MTQLPRCSFHTPGIAVLTPGLGFGHPALWLLIIMTWLAKLNNLIYMVWPTCVQFWIGWKDRLCTCGSHRKPFLQSLLQVFSIWRQITHLSCRRFGFFSTLKFGRILLAAIPLMCCNKTSLVISLNSTNNTWGKKRHSTGLEWKSS